MPQFRKLTNDQLQNLIILSIVILFLAVLIEPVATIIKAVVILAVIPMILTNNFANFVDHLDDNVDLQSEFSPLNHLVYAVGFALLLCIVMSGIAIRSIDIPMIVIEAIAPTLLFSIPIFLCSLCGYAVAWRTIPGRSN